MCKGELERMVDPYSEKFRKCRHRQRQKRGRLDVSTIDAIGTLLLLTTPTRVSSMLS